MVADHKLNVSLVNEENQEVKGLGDRFLQVIVRKLAKLFNSSYSSFETCKTKKAKEILRSGGNKDVGTVQKCARINRKQTKNNVFQNNEFSCCWDMALRSPNPLQGA